MKSTPTTAKPAPTKQPIPVLRLRFVDERQDGPGLSVASSCTSTLDPKNGRKQKHLIWYMPWLRAFYVQLLERAGADSKVLDAAYIGEARVMWWLPAEHPKLPQG